MISGSPGAGRFAPSPTGPLHLGSLLAATASYVDAKSLGLAWHVRLDDLDVLRNQPGAGPAILRALEAHGLCWDGPVTRQSDEQERYELALRTLDAEDVLFYCRCSRSALAGMRVYPGTCRGQKRPRPDSALRARVDDAVIDWDDVVQGRRVQRLADDPGDFVVRRRDGFIAYRLATAVDDGAPAITRVIRGRDLLEVTGPQIFLMQRLGLDVPVYGHVPVLLNEAGQKLSKQNLAPPLDPALAAANLARVLGALGLDPGPDAERRDCGALLEAAITRYRPDALRRNDLQIPTRASGDRTKPAHGEDAPAAHRE